MPAKKTQEEKDAAKAARAKAKADKKAAEEAEKESAEKTEEVKAEEKEEESSVEESEPVNVESKPTVVVRFEGADVLEILNDRRHIKGAVHCKLNDGTTKHVPRSLFEEAGLPIPEFAEATDQVSN